MQILKNLYVLDHKAHVSVSDGGLELRIDRELRGRYPLEGLDQVVVVGRGQVTTEAIARCVDHGVGVAVLSATGRIRFTVSPPLSGNIHLRMAQRRHADSEDHSLLIAADIVAGKLQNQRQMIRRWAADHRGTDRADLLSCKERIEDRLGRLYEPVDHDQVRGIEGDATRLYFRALALHLASSASVFKFVRRSRRPPADPTNALLSFVYALLTTECAGAAEAVGLDPQLGFLHGMRSGRPSLALDLIEEFRVPLADRLAVSMLTRRELLERDFETTDGTFWSLSDAGRRKVLARLTELRAVPVRHQLLDRDVPRAALPSVQATLLARHLRGDLERYPPFVMSA